MYSHYEKSRIPFSYVLYAYSVKRAYRGTKPKESFWLHYVPVERTSCTYILVVCTFCMYLLVVLGVCAIFKY